MRIESSPLQTYGLKLALMIGAAGFMALTGADMSFAVEAVAEQLQPPTCENTFPHLINTTPVADLNNDGEIHLRKHIVEMCGENQQFSRTYIFDVFQDANDNGQLDAEDPKIGERRISELGLFYQGTRNFDVVLAPR